MTALKLPNSVASQQDLTALILEVHTYAKWFSHVMVKQQVHVGQMGEPPPVSEAAGQLLHAWAAGQPLSQQRLDELLAALEEFKTTAPSITITLAAPAPGDLKQTLTAWCRQNIAPSILVTFKFNATLLGGMVVRYGSHVLDWSFRRQILAARGNFPGILRRV